MDPRLVQSSRIVKISGVALILMSLIAMIIAITNLATIKTRTNISELVFSLMYSVGLVVAGVSAIRSGITGSYKWAKVTFGVVLACLITYVVAFIVSLMLMIVYENDLTPKACTALQEQHVCEQLIEVAAGHWLEIAASLFIVGLLSCFLCLFITYRHMRLTKDVDGVAHV